MVWARDYLGKAMKLFHRFEIEFSQQAVLPYNGNYSRKKMFANFANPGVFANIFLLNFHFYYSSEAKVYSWLKHSAVIALEPGRLL